MIKTIINMLNELPNDQYTVWLSKDAFEMIRKELGGDVSEWILFDQNKRLFGDFNAYLDEEMNDSLVRIERMFSN